MNAVDKEQETKRISFGLSHKNAKKGLQLSRLLQKLPAGLPVLVYLSNWKAWDGPFKFIQVEDETVVVQTSQGRTIFCSSCIKPLKRPKGEALEATVGGESVNTFVDKQVKDGI